MRLCGLVESVDDLPAAAPVGDVYYIGAARAVAVRLDVGWDIYPIVVSLDTPYRG